jgi:uncharacterized protein YfbU (UPF0304 family)
MRLSQFERLSLINQLEIRKAVGAGDIEQLDEKIEILRGGFEVLYAENGLCPTQPREEGEFVFRVLCLYRIIEAHKTEHRCAPLLAAIPSARFSGFDGETEPGCVAFTRFLIKRQKKFAEQRRYEHETDAFDSHAPMRPTYARMLARWHALGLSTRFEHEEVIQILSDEASACIGRSM